FCTLKYGTTFPRYKKIRVNGAFSAPLYVYLKKRIKGLIKWNFTKFLVDREGNVVARFAPNVKPEDLEDKIIPLLNK
nr:glutathione peroxidase [Bacilli bacterium]